jgi:hypothetical protein
VSGSPDSDEKERLRKSRGPFSDVATVKATSVRFAYEHCVCFNSPAHSNAFHTMLKSDGTFEFVTGARRELQIRV